MATIELAFAPVSAPSIRINVSVDGRPFGQLWTFENTKTERHGWHAKTLGGAYQLFDTGSGEADAHNARVAKEADYYTAVAWMREQAA